MTEAPKRIVVLWTPADEDTMPATVAAHTEKSRDFVSGAPRWTDGERVEYIRADEVQRLIDEAVEKERTRCADIVASYVGTGRIVEEIRAAVGGSNE